jgi:tetratricopeptide (TPR) repeat protein
MKKLFGGIILLFFVSTIHAQTDTLNYEHANGFYEKADYAGAIAAYEALLQKQGPSPEIYYNLGNAYYKINNIGLSILNYERALKYKPGDEDIEYNLELAKLRIRDQIDPVNEMILIIWWRNFILLLTTHSWAVILITALWVAFAGFIAYMFSKSESLNKAGFYFLASCAFLFLISLAAAIGRNRYDKNYRFAIVTEPSTIVKSEPSESSTNLALIHEGLKIQVLGAESNWIEIKLPNGEIGWLQSSVMEAV